MERNAYAVVTNLVGTLPNAGRQVARLLCLTIATAMVTACVPHLRAAGSGEVSLLSITSPGTEDTAGVSTPPPSVDTAEMNLEGYHYESLPTSGPPYHTIDRNALEEWLRRNPRPTPGLAWNAPTWDTPYGPIAWYAPLETGNLQGILGSEIAVTANAVCLPLNNGRWLIYKEGDYIEVPKVNLCGGRWDKDGVYHRPTSYTP